MSTNKQALRSKARSASAGEWIKESGDGWDAICSSDDQVNCSFVIAHFGGPDSKANREFVQAANPATVLALLDELEAAKARIADLEAREVVLPPLVDCSNVPFAAYSWNAYRAEAVKALRAAGITVEGE